MAKTKSRKVAAKPNRVAVKADRKTNKGGVRMVNVGGASKPSSTKAVDEARALAQDAFAAQQTDEIGPIPRVTKTTRGKKTVVTEETAQQTQGRLATRKKRAAQMAELPAGQTVVMRQPSTPGALAAGVAEASVPVSGTGAGSAPSPVVSTAPGKLVNVRRTRKGRGSVGAPDSAGSGDMIEIRDRAEISADRRAAKGRSPAVKPGRSRSGDRRAVSSAALKSTSGTVNTRRRGAAKFDKLTLAQIPTSQERADGAYQGDNKTANPDAVVPTTASERHIYYAMKARESDVQNVSSNIQSRQIAEAMKRAGTTTSKAAKPEDVAAALKAKKIKKAEAEDLLRGSRVKVQNPINLGIQGSKEDTEAALKAGHITETDAMHISADYAADRLVPTTDKYVGSDLAMAHELSNHLGHPASVIQRYVRDRVPGGMKEYRDKIISNIRGEGKLTHWTPTGDPKRPYAPSTSRKSGTVRARRRKGLENRTVDVTTPTGGPAGSLAHHDYEKLQITNYSEESPTQKSTSRKRGSHPITDSILSDVMTHGAVTVHTPQGETFDYKKVAGKAQRVSKPQAKPKGFVPPKGSGGSVAIAENAGTTPTVYKKAGFTSVRSPRRPT
jgi:hypothetical protein